MATVEKNALAPLFFRAIQYGMKSNGKPIYVLERKLTGWKKVCASCRQPFIAKRSHAVTCSPTCRKRLWRAERAGK